MSDQFFDDEDELAAGQAQVEKPAPASAKGAPVPNSKKASMSVADAPDATPGRKPPTFGMAVAIAVVALLLGVCLGYFFAMSVVSRTGGVAVSQTSTMGTQASSSETQGSSDSATETELPSGHPDLTQFYNEDGTVNQEAIDAWKAGNAASTGASDTQEG